MTVVPEGAHETAAGDLLAAVLDYARRGWPVFPVRANKEPLTAHGFLDATTDPEQIRAWWQRWPNAGIAIATGTVSGLIVLDEDTPKGGAGSLVALERRLGSLPKTYTVLSGGGGRHYYFQHPGEHIPCSTGVLGDGLDIRADGGYAIAPPTLHQLGRRYKLLHARERLELPAAWLDALRPNTNGAAPKLAEIIPVGQRHTTMVSVAGSMRRRGHTADEILAALLATNERCAEPVTSNELREIAFDIEQRYEPNPETAIRTVPVVGPRPIDDVLDVFRRWLHLPDPDVVYVSCAAVAANRVASFDPTWLILVGAAGSGKTEALSATSRLDGVHVVATLTEAALLSGTPRKETAAGASGGLLREIGVSGIIVLKDFGSILSMHRDARASVLAAMRELFDGSWTRLIGVDGGRRLHWEGRVGLLAGATTVLDQHHAVMAQLGERFLIYRVAVDDACAQGHSSLAHHGRERGMRQELSEAIAGLFAGLDHTNPPPLADADRDRLVSLAMLVARARSPVVRDSYRREIEQVPDSEAPGRIVGALARLLTGLRMIGVCEPEAWRVTVKTGLDSMPAARRQAIELLLVQESATTTDIATRLGLPNPTAHRVLEDLAAHDVVARESQGQGKADIWRIRPGIVELHGAATSSEKSELSISNHFHNTYDDFSEEVGAEQSSSRSARPSRTRSTP